LKTEKFWCWQRVDMKKQYSEYRDERRMIIRRKEIWKMLNPFSLYLGAEVDGVPKITVILKEIETSANV
jgi:hypothetical protein